MANERKTEALVRDGLRSLGYNDPDNGITVEEQKSEIAKVKSLLSKASKNAKGNAGYPEFIVSNRKDTAFLIVFECKPDVKKHESPSRDKPVDFAVDGVLHYARHLSKHYTVVAVAVSGSTLSSLKISNFLVAAGTTEVKELRNEAGLAVASIVPYDDYYRLASFDPAVAKKRHADLLAFSRELHELIWTKAKVAEEDKPLLVSGTLIALMNLPFMKTFGALPAEDIQDAWLAATLVVAGKTVVILNSSHSLGRQASDLTHELAHRIRGHETHEASASLDDMMLLSAYDKKQEEEADWLSSCLLLPRDALVSIKQRGLDFEVAAQHYCVSVRMLKYRMSMTGVDRQYGRSGR